jgi:hypothetical protein
VADNPFPVLYGDRGDGTTVTSASDEAELVEDARRDLTRRLERERAGLRFESVQLVIPFVC